LTLKTNSGAARGRAEKADRPGGNQGGWRK